VQNNHSKNGTTIFTCHGDAPSVSRRKLVGRIEHDHLPDGRTRIHPPDTLIREPFHRRLGQSEETGHGPRRHVRLDARQRYLPHRCLRRAIEARFCDIHHINTVGQCRVQAGLKPAEYAIGSPATRTPRSKARATSRWLANRIFPRLAYRTTKCCAAGNDA
jgi:hypothetical protein